MIGFDRAWVAVASAGLLLSTPAFADVKAGVDAWTKGDFNAAVSEWTGPASKGDADAQFNLGQAYKLGRGVKQDLAKAEDLFGRAAGQGHLQASDNYGLLLFQRGERARAMPFLKAAADRGDPRAEYLLGIAHFNGDNVPKDWVRAYALVSLAQQAGLSQASGALSQMDQYIPIEQRQQSVALAQDLAAKAEATRARQLAANDLGVSVGGSPEVPQRVAANVPTAPMITAQPPASRALASTTGSSARDAGADFSQPKPAAPPVAVSAPAIAAAPRSAPPVPTRAATPPAAASGPWRIQLGAFGVAGNAEALWNRIKSRPEVAGHARALIPAGRVTKLQATGYASEAAAKSACNRLSSAGVDCIPIRN
ncbi:MAG: SPOR domain-containing protein [Novosphingobium sp.]